MKFKIDEIKGGYLIKTKDGCVLGQIKKFPPELPVAIDTKELINKITGI